MNMHKTQNPEKYIDPEVRALLLNIMRTFPEVGKAMIARARSVRGVWFATTFMMNEFSEMTTAAIGERNEALARAYLNHASRLLIDAGKKGREYIDVYYVEDLMWNLDAESKKWGWTIIPKNLRDLYVAMWGYPKFG
jgi:hypothetical protein